VERIEIQNFQRKENCYESIWIKENKEELSPSNTATHAPSEQLKTQAGNFGQKLRKEEITENV
jgi:hypothetical protein